jgi:hypothetical protein
LAPKSTTYFNNYNALTYCKPSYHQLYSTIQQIFHKVKDKNIDYYIQCWINVFSKNNKLSRHGHWAFDDCWHGYFCVEVEPSSTTYSFSDQSSSIKVINKNNTLIIGKSHLDKHETSNWEEDHNRITIAFDIVPYNRISGLQLNHFLPI